MTKVQPKKDSIAFALIEVSLDRLEWNARSCDIVDVSVKWQKEVPNAQILTDKERVIENLSKQIATLTTEISTVRSQPVGRVDVNVNSQ